MPPSAQDYLRFAQTLCDQGYLPAARHAYGQAYQRDPHNREVIIQLAKLLEQMGTCRRLRHCCTVACNNSPMKWSYCG